MPDLCKGSPLTALAAALLLTVPVAAGVPHVHKVRVFEPAPTYAPKEPFANSLSLANAADHLDVVAMDWQKYHRCGDCHANFVYLLARPALLGEKPAAVLDEARRFMEQRMTKRMTNWNSDQPYWRRNFDTEAVTTAAAFVFHDRQTAGHLRPTTRQVLDKMWSLQQSDGAWKVPGDNNSFPAAEPDHYYTASLAALAVGSAPDAYAEAPQIQKGLEKLLQFFAKTPPPNLHHRTMLLWASMHLDGLMTPAQQEVAIKEILAAQRTDGGWSFASMIPQRQHIDYQMKATVPPSDGYGTGFALYVLRQAGVAADRPEIARGVHWLRSRQRASGRWFTPSPDYDCGDKDMFITNAGTAFAALALKACAATEKPARPERLVGLTVLGTAPGLKRSPVFFGGIMP